MGTAKDTPLRFTTHLAPDMYRVYDAIVRHVASTLARPVELRVGGDYAELARGDVDFSFV
jgi:hypothetical protein